MRAKILDAVLEAAAFQLWEHYPERLPAWADIPERSCFSISRAHFRLMAKAALSAATCEAEGGWRAGIGDYEKGYLQGRADMIRSVIANSENMTRGMLISWLKHEIGEGEAKDAE